MCKFSHATLDRILIVLSILSALISVGVIAIWATICYDVLILADVRQRVRLFILQQVDKDLEQALDQHMPGPQGHRGQVAIQEPPDYVIAFEQPAVFVVVAIGTILGQAIQFLLAIWLFIVVKTGSHEGVRVWFIGTLLIVIGTFIGLIIALSLVTFHSTYVITTSFLIIFYIIALCFAIKYKPKFAIVKPDIEESNNFKKSTEKISVQNCTDYAPVHKPMSICAELSSCLL